MGAASVMIGRRHIYVVLATLAIGLTGQGEADAAWQPEFAAQVRLSGALGDAVEIGDLNSDGRNDIVAVPANVGPATPADYVAVFEQRDDGTLEKELHLLQDETAVGLDIGDIDADGDSDLAVSVQGGIRVFRQAAGELGSPNFIPAVITGPTELEIADVFVDGHPDFVVGNRFLDGTFVLRTEADGSHTPVWLGMWSGDVSVGDLNHDGLPDIASAVHPGYVHYQRPDGGFDDVAIGSQLQAAGHSAASGVDTGDATGDGLEDLVVTSPANTPNARVSVFRQLPSGDLAPPASYETHDLPVPVEVADMNGDLLGDVVVGHDSWMEFGIHPQVAAGLLGSELRFPTDYTAMAPNGMAVGDINCDGRRDVVVAAAQNSRLTVHRQVSGVADAPGGACPAAPTEPLSPSPDPEYQAGAPADRIDRILPSLEPGETGTAVADDEVFFGMGGYIAASGEPGQRLISNSVISLARGGGQDLSKVADIEFGADGLIYAISADGFGTSGTAIVSIDPVSGRQRLVSTDPISVEAGGTGTFSNLSSLAVEADGDLVVTNFNEIIEVDTTTGRQRIVTNPEVAASVGEVHLDWANGIEVGADGTIFVTDSVNSSGPTGSVVAVDPETGVQSIASEGGWLVRPQRTAMTSDGRLLVLDRSGSNRDVIAVDLETGAQEKVLFDLPSQYNGPLDLAVEADGSIIISTDRGSGSLVRFDPSTGQTAPVDTGGFIFEPVGLAISGFARSLPDDPSEEPTDEPPNAPGDPFGPPPVPPWSEPGTSPGPPATGGAVINPKLKRSGCQRKRKGSKQRKRCRAKR